jgi:hypothetical protein
MNSNGLLERTITSSAAILAVILSVALYSRIPAVWGGFTGIAPLAVLCLSVGSGLRTLITPKGFLTYVVVMLFLALGSLWVVLFANTTKYPSHMTNALIFHGIYCTISFMSLTRYYGKVWAISALYYISLAYIVAYVVLASLLFLNIGGLDVRSSAILFDAERGNRLYQSSALCALVIFYSLKQVRNMRLLIPAAIAVFGGALSLYLAQSRFATFSIGVVIVLFAIPKVLRTYIATALAFSPMIILAVWIYNPLLVAGQIEGVDSLAIRAKAFVLARDLFISNPLLGIGIQSSPTDLFEIHGFPFSPSDIGPAGIAVSFGIVGLVIYFLGVFKLVSIYRASLRTGTSLVEQSFGEAALFCVLYSAISPTILVFDGAIILAFAMQIGGKRSASSEVNAAEP